ncbi:MAG: tripartite tricarboxylate transporter substrate binding protein [Firmicutes bacterium]|jgi:tripartite-type tricarboxylate transporter receptor subunit TctC|nr:tripartite tricarboxylate transporter substrate binding protein [Bacillota bacterium]
MKRLAVLLTLVLASALLNTSGYAASWPDRAITVILGWSAGGTSDTTVRAVVREMSEFLGKPIQVTNVDGANGGIAGQRVAQSRPDGYTFFGGAMVQGTWLVTKQAQVSWEDFYSFPAGMGGTTIYVRADSPYRDLNDLIAAIKKADKPVRYGSTGAGGNGAIFAQAVVQAAGVADRTIEVPYNGGREAGRFLLSGAVEFCSVSLGDISDWAEAGQVRPLANLYPKDFHWRGVTFPTINRFYPQLEVYTAINPYWGIAVRRDTPPETVERIAEAFVYAVKHPRFQESLESRGIIVAPLMGVASDQAVSKVGSGRTWPQYELGIVSDSPAKFNIPRITEWSWPPNQAAAKIRPWPAKVEELFAQELAEFTK